MQHDQIMLNFIFNRGRGQGQSDPKQYVTLGDPKAYLHTKFGIPASNNLEGVLLTIFFKN